MEAVLRALLLLLFAEITFIDLDDDDRLLGLFVLPLFRLLDRASFTHLRLDSPDFFRLLLTDAERCVDRAFILLPGLDFPDLGLLLRSPEEAERFVDTALFLPAV